MAPYEWLVDKLISELDDTSARHDFRLLGCTGDIPLSSDSREGTLQVELRRALKLWNASIRSMPLEHVYRHPLVQDLDKNPRTACLHRLTSTHMLTDQETEKLKTRWRRRHSTSPRQGYQIQRKVSWPCCADRHPRESSVWAELTHTTKIDTVTPVWLLSDEFFHLMDSTYNSGPNAAVSMDLPGSSINTSSRDAHSSRSQYETAWYDRQQSSKLSALFMEDKERRWSSQDEAPSSVASISASHQLLEEFEVDCRLRAGQPLPLSSDEDVSSTSLSSPRTLAPWNTSFMGGKDSRPGPEEEDVTDEYLGDWVRLSLYLPPYHTEDPNLSSVVSAPMDHHGAVGWPQVTTRCRFNVRVLREATVENVLDGLREILRRAIARDNMRHHLPGGGGDPNLALMLACVWELHPSVDDFISEGFYLEKKRTMRRLIRRPDLTVPPLALNMTVSQIISAGTTDFAVSVVDTPTLPAVGQPVPTQPYIDQDVCRYVASLHRKIGIGGV